MARKKRWKNSHLVKAVSFSSSVRQVLHKLNLAEAGGNYEHIRRYIHELKLDTSHFTGKGWSKGLKIPKKPIFSLKEILVNKSNFQSFKLKKRLFKEDIKAEKCEECGWANKAKDGRIPLELDHINGDRHDNRIENLRILCPNCHSLQPTHRGRNIKRPAR